VRFLRAPLVLLVLVLLVLPSGRADATDFAVFAAKLSLSVDVVVGNQIVQRTLKENDIVNLALGRPLGTKVDKKTEVLAVAINADELIGTAIIFNPSQNGLAQVTTTVAEPTLKDFERAYLFSGGEGYGTITGTVVPTTLGTPSLNGLLASTLVAAGGGKSSAARSAAVKGSLSGRLSFRVTENGQTTTLSGFIVNGKAKVSGKPLSLFEDNTSARCGDGVVQAQLGEDCEFFDDSACPGKCDVCKCVVCGNNRVDTGESCDGTANAICAAQNPPVPCKADCTGCQF
jgi:hypothetical protein